MKGPLDALIESEALAANPFDDSLEGPQLNPAAPKKFKLRRFLKKLFKRNKSTVVRVKAADPRQVKIVLISWSVGVVGLIGLLTAFWAFSPGSGPELLQKANEAVMAEDYGRAIAVYDDFLKHYPNVANSNEVRLLRCLAELRLAEKQATASGDWTPAFDVAQAQVRVLPKGGQDSDTLQAFSIALAQIGEALARQSRGQPDAASIARVQSIVDMLETVIPEGQRPAKMIEEIKGILRPGRQQVEGRRQLDQTIDAIGAAAKANDVKAAYAAYRETVQLFPELSDDARLTDAMKQVSALQLAAVKPIGQSLAAVRAERSSGLLAAAPLAVQPLQGELAEGRKKLLFVVEQGTAYGLDAATGRTLWRRFVALDAKFPTVTALPIAGPAGNDVVLCDFAHQEVLRVAGATGELLWRLTVQAPIVALPVLADKRLLLLTKDQRLLLIDLATGDSARYFSLPQAVGLPPVFDAARGLIFLVAEHSNLIVLDDERCWQVLHVGHEAGTIAAPPVVVGDFLLAAINTAPGEATVRVFSISPGGADGPLRRVQAIRLAGHVGAAPVVLGQGAVVVTAEGSLYALQRNGAEEKSSFQVVASKLAGFDDKSPHYAVSSGSAFWVADRQLTRYAVRTNEQQIVRRSTTDLSMQFVQGPAIDGQTMFHVLRKAGMPGLMVSAFDLEKNEAVWQTWLAAPLVGEPMCDPVSGKLIAITSSGGMFRLPLDGLRPAGKPLEEPDKPPERPAPRPWEPVLTVDLNRLGRPLRTLLPLGGGTFAMTGGADSTQIVLYDPKEQDKQFRWLLCPRAMSAGPGAFAGGLLTACRNGQVFLLDLEARGDMVNALPPAIKGVSTWEWRTPLAVDDRLAILSDGDKRLMAIGIGSSDDEKALTVMATATTNSRLVSPVAVLDKLVFLVARNAADPTDSLLSFQLPGLAPGKPQVLGGRCAWGPQRVGKLVLVATEEGRLLAFNPQGEAVWQSPLAYGPLAGAPLLVGDEILLSARSGTVWRISVSDGKELGKIDAGCPLGTGPLVVDARVIVGGHEGSLLEIKRP